MTRRRVVGLGLLAALAVSGSGLGHAQAEDDEAVEIELQGGGTVKGKLVDFGKRVYRVEVDGKVQEIGENTVKTVRFLGHTPETPATKVTLQFVDANVKTVLQLLAAHSGKNIVIAPEVQGTVTLDLHGVPWLKALHAIVKACGDFEIVELSPDLLQVVPASALGRAGVTGGGVAEVNSRTPTAPVPESGVLVVGSVTEVEPNGFKVRETSGELRTFCLPDPDDTSRARLSLLLQKVKKGSKVALEYRVSGERNVLIQLVVGGDAGPQR